MTFHFEDFIVGENNEDIYLETREENQVATRVLAKQAKKSIHLFSYQLNQALYDDADFLESIKRWNCPLFDNFLTSIPNDSRRWARSFCAGSLSAEMLFTRLIRNRTECGSAFVSPLSCRRRIPSSSWNDSWGKLSSSLANLRS